MSYAAETARKILSRHWDWKIPVDLDSIADKLGITVIYPLGIDGDYDISGKFCIEDGVPICYINQFDVPHRQRFTLAHELGHYQLGHGEQTDMYRDPNAYQSPLEREANAFAAELIMPKVAIDYFIQEKKMTSLSALAEKFGVSEIAMRYRLKNTGWL